MGRASRNEEVDRQDAADAVFDRVGAPEDPAACGARPDRDDDPGLRDRVVRLDQRLPHVLRHGARDQEPVRVPGRGDEVDPEPLQVEDRVAQRLRLEVAPVAPPGGHLPQVERPAEQGAQVGRSRGVAWHRPAQDEMLTFSPREARILRKADPLAAARLLAQTAEDAPPEVHRLFLRVDGVRGARLRARLGNVSHPECFAEYRHPPERCREVPRSQTDGDLSRADPLQDGFNHRFPLTGPPPSTTG